MKHKASLTLIEVAIMLLIFSLAAALCLQGFVWADRHSAYQADADRALEQAQQAAEWIKHSSGDLAACREHFGGSADAKAWTLSYDENWTPSDSGCFTLLAQKQDSGIPGLGCIRITVTDATGESLALLEICYQEVASHA